MAGETFIVREPGSGTRLAMLQFFTLANVAFKVGMGISFISQHTVGLELQTQKLAVLEVRGLPMIRHWNVAHLANERLLPVASAFKAFVLEHGAALLSAQRVCPRIAQALCAGFDSIVR